MKKVLAFLLFLVPSCIPKNSLNAQKLYTAVGALDSQRKWVYLCGLVDEFHPKHMKELAVIDAIGKQLHIQFLAIAPTARCKELANKLCWPHESKSEILSTFAHINNALECQPIEGYIGFSNGGFFLAHLAQYVKISCPLIALGSAGNIVHQDCPNNILYLLIGKDDVWHYKPARAFLDKSKSSHVHVTMIEYLGGHAIPEKELTDLLKTLLK